MTAPWSPVNKKRKKILLEQLKNREIKVVEGNCQIALYFFLSYSGYGGCVFV